MRSHGSGTHQLNGLIGRIDRPEERGVNVDEILESNDTEVFRSELSVDDRASGKVTGDGVTRT
jgi:hypothetical protein